MLSAINASDKKNPMQSELENLILKLRSKGERITVPRRWTLQVLLTERGHLTIERIHQQLAANNIQVDEATIYRTLQWLKEHGIVAQTDVGQGADIYSLLDDDPHHHLICLNCGYTINADDDIFASLRAQLAERYGFHPRIEHYAIFGYCEHCREELADAL